MACPQTLSLSFKSSLLDNIQPALLKFRSRNPHSTSYSLLVYRLAKPQADSPISYAFRLIWLCVRVFRVSVYYFFHRVFEPGPLKQGAGKELETRVGDDGNEHKPRTGSDGKEKGKK